MGYHNYKNIQNKGRENHLKVTIMSMYRLTQQQSFINHLPKLNVKYYLLLLQYFCIKSSLLPVPFCESQLVHITYNLTFYERTKILNQKSFFSR